MKILLVTFFIFSFITTLGQKTIGDLLEETPQGQKGIKHYTKIIKLDSNIAEAYWRRGYEYYRTKRYSLALPDFSKAISKDPHFNFANVIADRGLTKEMLGMFEDAIVDFSQAIAYSYKQDTTIPQGFEKYYYHRGRTKFKLSDTTNAILDLDSSLKFWNFHY
ncbi:MAG TPA: tetratricopeptide repeat protein, partial [Chitinophagaceae bacterium]